jgi:hypothetical protein
MTHTATCVPSTEHGWQASPRQGSSDRFSGHHGQIQNLSSLRLISAELNRYVPRRCDTALRGGAEFPS